MSKVGFQRNQLRIYISFQIIEYCNYTISIKTSH